MSARAIPEVIASSKLFFDDDWISVIEGQTWMADDTVRSYAGDGPLITDDQPRPEYFLLRGLAEMLRR